MPALRQSSRVREPLVRTIEGTDRARLPHEGHRFPHGSRRLLRGVPAKSERIVASDEWLVASFPPPNGSLCFHPQPPRPFFGGGGGVSFSPPSASNKNAISTLPH